LNILRTERHTVNNKTTTKFYRNDQTHVNLSIIFLQKQDDKDLYLEFGEYTYSFQIQLPLNIPPSFQHHIGKIRYYAKGTIDIPW